MKLARPLLLVLVGLLACGAVSTATAKEKKEEKLDRKRAEIDAMAAETVKRLEASAPADKGLFDKAHGYAVFDNTKVAIGISGGGGRGVAVDRKTGKRTYMRMATVGVGFGLGGQNYRVVFAFETAEAFERFVTEGWEADASAQAAAGTDGANAESQFRNGMAMWQFTEAGLMARADVAGTKYWQNDKLN